MLQGRDETNLPNAREDGWRRRVAWLLISVAVGCAIVAIWGGLKGWEHGLSAARASAKYQVEGFVEWGEFWACVINAVLAAGLAGLLWGTTWGRGESPPITGQTASSSRVPGPVTRWGWVALLVLLGAAGALRWQRMGLSLYNDEAHTFRRYIAGHFSETSQGKVKWHPVTWIDTLWLDQVGNNSTPCSLLGRVGYDAWRKVTHAPDGAMSEAAIRFQAWLGGMGSLVFLWLLGRRLLPRGGAWWLLAMGGFHPWHLRYSTEARGYGLLLLGVAAGGYFLVRAWECQRWRWWLGLGLAQFLCVWSFPGIIYWLAVFQLLLGGSFLVRYLRGERDRVGWQRSLFGSAIGGMLALQWLLPIAPQLVDALKVLGSMKGEMGLAWWQDALGGLCYGLRWVDADASNPNNLTVSRLLSEHSAWMWTAWIMVGLLLGLGLWQLTRRGVPGLISGWSGPVAVGVSWAVMRAQGQFLHSWYIIYALPGVLLAWAQAARAWRHGVACWVATLALGASLAPFWWRADALFLRHGKENMQGVAQEIEAWKAQSGQEILVATLYSDVDVYFHPVHVINTVKDLQDLDKKASLSGQGFCVTLARKPLVAATRPDLLATLENPDAYEILPPQYGLDEAQFTHWIYRRKEVQKSEAPKTH